MDNFRIDITSEGDVNLERALLIAFSRSGSGAVGYAVRDAVPGVPHETKPRRLVLFWTTREADFVPLPFKLDAAAAADFARHWLAEQDYGKEPDHDGHNGRGWRIYNEAWGHVDGDYAAFVAIAPAWAMYGK